MIKSLKQPKNLQSGLSESVLISLLSWFVTGGLKFPSAPFLLPGDEVTIRETHELKPLLGWIELQLAPQKNQLDGKSVGEIFAQHFEFEIKVFVPGSYVEQHSLLQQLLNKPMIALIRDAECEADLWYQVGTSCHPAYLRHDFTTGTTKDGVKGYAAVIAATGNSIVIYKGGLSVLPPDLPGVLITEDGIDITDESGNGILLEG